MSEEKRFYSTKDLEKLLGFSSRTISRRRHDELNPLPPPKIARPGSKNLFCVREIEKYLAQEEDITISRQALNQS